MTRKRKGKTSTEANYGRGVRWPIGRCEPCDKAVYLTRANARRDARITPPSVGPRGGTPTRPRAYPCPHTPGHWHVGHLPDSVRRGTYSKQAWKEGKGKGDEG